MTRAVTGIVYFIASDWLNPNYLCDPHSKGLPVIFARVSLGDFHSKTFSKQHECVHWSLAKLMCVVSFHWA